MVILSASDISKFYGDNEILKNISFHINEGDRIGIVGNNGTGKSTLLKILAKEISYDSGSLYLSNKIDLGYLKQNDNFTSEDTVYNQVLSIFSNVIEMDDKIHKLADLISQESEKGNDTKSLLIEYDALSSE